MLCQVDSCPYSGQDTVVNGNTIQNINTINSGTGNDDMTLMVVDGTTERDVITNFHAGDQLFVFLTDDTSEIGWNGASSSMVIGTAATSYGGAASSQLTISFDSAHAPDLLLTMVGVSVDELRSNFNITAAPSPSTLNYNNFISFGADGQFPTYIGAGIIPGITFAS